MMAPKVDKTPAQWREQLTAAQFAIAREGGTEPAFTGQYCDEKRAGSYRCVCCGAQLFSAASKFDSGSGWPSFFEPASDAPIAQLEDRSHGMVRIEVQCADCAAHLGHVFPDGPQPSGQRYCINSAALRFEPDER